MLDSFLAGVLSSLVLAFLLTRFLRRHPLRHVPGPWINKHSGLHLALYELRSQRNQKVVEWHWKYGPVICIAPGQISIASLDAIRQVYGAAGRYDKSDFFNNFTAFNARSVFATLSHEEHRRKRPPVSSFFQASNLHIKPTIEAQIRDRAFSVLAGIEQERRRPVEFYALADWYSFDNITGLVFGPVHASTATKQPCKEREILANLKRSQAWSPTRRRLPWLMPIVKIIQRDLYHMDIGYFDAQRHLSQWAFDRTMKMLQDPTLPKTDCLVAHLAKKLSLPQVPVDKPSISETVRFIAAESLDNINAAEASVAATITHTVWYLSFYPDWQRQVQEELRALPMQSDGLPSFSDIDQRAPILDACIKEVHRLKPATGARAERVIPAGGRVLSDVYIPAKTTVSAVLAMHTDPDIFPDETAFEPSRWLQKEADGANDMALRHASLMPFGYGTRICLGQAAANMEMKILLAAMFSRYETTIPAGADMTESKQTRRPDGVKHGLKCEIECRPFTHIGGLGRGKGIECLKCASKNG